MASASVHPVGGGKFSKAVSASAPVASSTSRRPRNRAAGPKYFSLTAAIVQADRHAPHVMQSPVVSGPAGCPLASPDPAGSTRTYRSKKGAGSTTRSLITGRLRRGPTRTVCPGVGAAVWQARASRPSTTTAHVPHMPTRHEDRNERVGSWPSTITLSKSRIDACSPGSTSYLASWSPLDRSYRETTTRIVFTARSPHPRR